MDAGWKYALSLSLSQDLQQIKILMKEMGGQIKKHQLINSWLFPNRPYYVNEDTDAGTYTQCLESVLDGVYVVLNMLIVYINDSLPQRLTLGQSFEVLWIKVKEFVAVSRKRNPTPVSRGKSPRAAQKSSQTDDKTSPECDSCFVSMKCIKKVVNTLDEYADSTTKVARRNVRTHIFDTTLFGSMMQISTSIEKDVENLIENNKKLTGEIAALTAKHDALKLDYKEMKKSRVDKEKFEKLRIDHAKQCNKSSQLEKGLSKVSNDKNMLHARLVEFAKAQEKVVVDLESFKRYSDKVHNLIIVKLQANDNSLNRIRNVVGEYKKQKSVLITQLSKMNETNDGLNKRISEIENGSIAVFVGMRSTFENVIINIDNFRTAVKKRLDGSAEALHRIKELGERIVSAQLKVKYEKLHSVYNKEKEKRCRLEIRYYRSMEENKRLVNVSLRRGDVVKIKELYASVLEKFEEKEASILCGLDRRLESIKRVQSSIRRYTGDSTMVSVKGNPIEDMMRQIEVNEAKVSSLKRENCSLLKTVNKLKLMNLPGVK